MTSSTMIHVRVNESVKTQATQALTAMGLTVSDAVAESIINNRRARFATAEALVDDLEKASGQ